MTRQEMIAREKELSAMFWITTDNGDEGRDWSALEEELDRLRLELQAF